VRILLIFLACVTLIVMVTLPLFRFLARLLGMKQVLADGVVMTEEGLEYLGLAGLCKMKVPYREVESVESMPFLYGLASAMLFRYGMSSLWICTRPLHTIVVIKLRGPRMFRYLLSTPRNAHAFSQELKSRIQPPNRLWEQ
jgi:hypothetical protein